MSRLVIVECKPIPGYEGRYEITSEGRVVSLVTNRIMSQRLNAEGYMRVTLSPGDGSVREHLVHHLVLSAFVGPIPAGMERLHRDGDPTNNRLTNLRYGTRGENVADAVGHGTHHQASKTHCPQNHPYEEGNLYKGHKDRNERVCRTCKMQYVEAHREQKRAYDRERRRLRKVA